MRVELGNPAAKEAYRTDKGELKHRSLDGKRVTTVVVPDSYTLMEAAATVLAQDGAWNHHSQGDNVKDTVPDWVESDNDALTQILSEQLGCRIGRPKNWKADA